MRLARLCLSLGLIWLLATGAALAETRVALVIGNGAYENAGALANPVNDATDIAAELTKVGFQVVLGTDVDEDGFSDRLAQFSTMARTADVALFYYAGHGLQFDGQNYLLPVDARMADQFGVRREALALDEILAEMDRAKVSLVFIDACRNNPFADNLKQSMGSDRAASVGRGLARVETFDSDMLIAFAAAPGAVAADGDGRNSPFTTAILKHLATPGIEVSTMLKRVTLDVRAETKGAQQPQQLTSMAAEFYMVPAVATAPGPTPAPTAPATDDGEQFAFSAALAINTTEGWSAFLAEFPVGRYRDLAQAALTKLKPEAPVEVASTEPETPTPPAVDHTAEIDRLGKKGDAAYEAGRYAESFAAYSEAMALGDSEAIGALAYLYEAGLGTTKDLSKADEMYRTAIDAGSKYAAYNYAWMVENGNGVARRPAYTAELIALSLEGADVNGRTTLLNQVIEDVGLLGPDTRRALQEQLRDRGHYSGVIDGSFGPASLAALRQLARNE